MRERSLTARAWMALCWVALAPPGRALAAGPTEASVYGAGSCNLAAQPSASLLFPYFEVDLSDSGGVTTLIAVRNTRIAQGFDVATVARVTLWTDWGVPTLAFDMVIQAHGVQTVNLRDVFSNNVFPGEPAGVNLGKLKNCLTYRPSTQKLTEPEHQALRNKHSGKAAPTACFGEGHLHSFKARGYLTVDAVNACSALGTPGNANPAWGTASGYFGNGLSSALASDDNALTGDFFLVDPANDYASGSEAVHLPADYLRFDGTTNVRTYYGNFVGWNGSDDRVPLPSWWAVRYLNGGVFSGGTDLVVWRDTRANVRNFTGVTCGSRPNWIPLTVFSLRAYPEAPAASGSDVPLDPTKLPLATQRVSTADLAGASGLPGSFGTIEMRLDDALTNGASAFRQAAVLAIMSASGRFSVGVNAFRQKDACLP